YSIYIRTYIGKSEITRTNERKSEWYIRYARSNLPVRNYGLSVAQTMLQLGPHNSEIRFRGEIKVMRGTYYSEFRKENKCVAQMRVEYRKVYVYGHVGSPRDHQEGFTVFYDAPLKILQRGIILETSQRCARQHVLVECQNVLSRIAHNKNLGNREIYRGRECSLQGLTNIAKTFPRRVEENQSTYVDVRNRDSITAGEAFSQGFRASLYEPLRL
ncbi:hypothetical protein V1478_012000, partial [Vespula squamosa]